MVSAASRAEAWQVLTEQSMHIALVDGHCDNLTGLLAMLHAAPNPPKVVVLGIAEERNTVLALASEGIHGYLDKDAPLDDLVTAIRHARRDELACSPAIAGSLLRQVSRLSTRQPGRPRLDELTCRERELAQLIVEGLSNKEIASRLDISVATVKSHVHHILEKLGVHRRSKVREAIRDTIAGPDRESLRS